jgi:hypothetical protein
MLKQSLEKNSLILLTVVMIVVMVIVSYLVLIVGTVPPTNVTLSVQSSSSSETPPHTQYLLVESVAPSGSKVSWKDVNVFVRPDCHYSEGSPVKCPRAVRMVQGQNYTIHDNDGNGRVSKGDVLEFNIWGGSHWGKILSFEWSKTKNVMYWETLPPSP